MGSTMTKAEEMVFIRDDAKDSEEDDSNDDAESDNSDSDDVARSESDDEECDNQVDDMNLKRVNESLMQAVILKYFAQENDDSAEKYDQLWTDEENTEDEVEPGKFSELCASNFIRLGPSMIGYPAESWIQNGAYEIPASEDDKEQSKPIQIWITRQSHSSSSILKNDIFLKMCAVEEMNRGNMIEQRAYLDVNGDILYFPKSALKQGISDFVAHFEKTERFELNAKEYSASWKSIVEALTLKPHFVNNVLDESKMLTIDGQNSDVESEESSETARNGVDGDSENAECSDVVSGLSKLSIEDSAGKLVDSLERDLTEQSMEALRESSFLREMIDVLVETAEDKVYGILHDSQASKEMNESSDDAGDSESTTDSSGTSLSSESIQMDDSNSSKRVYQSIVLEETQDTDADVLRCHEEMKFNSLPTSLREMGFGVFHPRECDVVTKLSRHTDAYWQKKNRPAKPINVIKSCDEVSSSLIKALESTSSKMNAAEGKKVEQPKSKGSSSKVGENVKTKKTPATAKTQKTPATAKTQKKEASSNIVYPYWKKRKPSKKKSEGSTRDKPAELPSSANVKKTVDVQPESVGRSDKELSNDEVEDVDDIVQRCIPAFFGKHQPATQGLSRHLHNSQTPPIGRQLPKTATSVGGLGSTVLAGAAPSTFKTSAPPMGAIPVRASTSTLLSREYVKPSQDIEAPRDASSAPQDARKLIEEGRPLDVQDVLEYSSHLDEFGHLVVQFMELMTLEQRTFAINIISDVLIEGKNNSLCQFTRLSGIRSSSGTPVFRMGPSHSSDALQLNSSGSSTIQQSYGFPSSHALPPKCPSKEKSHGGNSQATNLPAQNPLNVHQGHPNQTTMSKKQAKKLKYKELTQSRQMSSQQPQKSPSEKPPRLHHQPNQLPQN